MIPSSSRSSAGLSDNRSRCASSSSEETKDTSALISSANEYLADVIADLTQQSTLVTLERRKSYWRILRASKHLSMVKSTLVAIDAKSRSNAKSVIENQSVSTEVLPTGPLSVSENSTKRAELSDSKNVMTESLSIGSPLLVTELSKTVVGSVFAEIRSLLVMDPVVKTEFQVIAQNVLAATERTPIPVDTHATNSTSAEIRTASKLADASTIPSDAHKVSLLPQPVIAITPAEPGLTSAKVSSQPDGSIKSCVEDSSRQIASEALTIVAEIQSDESIAAKIEDEKELNKRKVVNEVVEDFSRRMGSISMETNMQQWLVISRSYWAALRESKREPVDPVEVPVVEAPMTYFSSNQIQGNSSNLGGLSARTGSSVNATVEVDLSSDRMHMSGFAGIAKKLPSMHPADVTLTLWGLDKFELWPTQLVATNPSYTYEDNPLPGWSKNICVRMGGKLQGSLEITYCPPERTRRLRNRIEILAYLTKYNLSTYLTSRFDFRSVFCVCHTPEDSGSYLECSFGRAGCNRWLHSHCVGLGKRKEGELRDMATVICPLCTQYLESIGASDYMKNKTLVALSFYVQLFLLLLESNCHVTA